MMLMMLKLDRLDLLQNRWNRFIQKLSGIRMVSLVVFNIKDWRHILQRVYKNWLKRTRSYHIDWI